MDTGCGMPCSPSSRDEVLLEADFSLEKRLRRRPGILIADDTPLVLALLKVVLDQHDIRVFSAMDGCQAIELFRSYQEEIDLCCSTCTCRT
jgi:hypothetical protein